MDASLPEPTITFTIPSINDATTLSCRIYHPLSLLAASPRVKEWRGQAAVFAHPYGPLGGCADDHVVGAVAGAILRKGFVVCTFNFRGAGDSGGRTSWTAKGEKADYVSVAAFTAYYTHFLYSMTYNGNEASLPDDKPVLVLGGYSYGSMITSQVPPLEDILQLFKKPDIGSAAAEIRLRAEHLAEQQAEVLRHLRELGARARGHGIRVGGTESGDVKGTSEGRHSFIVEAEEKIRRSIEHAVARTKRHSRGRSDGSKSAKEGDRSSEVERRVTKEPEEKRGPVRLEEVGFRVPRVGYVLVSPLQGFVTHLATMSFMPSRLPSFLSGLKAPLKHNKDDEHTQADGDSPDSRNILPKDTSADPSDEPEGAPSENTELKPAELKLVQNPTLAIFGDNDVFVSVHRLRAWARRMRDAPGSRFHPVEVSSAGHFWVEERVLDKLVGVVGGFVAGLVEAGAS